ncbi:MAG: cytochrome C554 [Candidatus Neomarinimicrobiota bacterium]|nr:MAG: cytochrome C554 [Candidatus Neomarinimicrobiota bacterium]
MKKWLVLALLAIGVLMAQQNEYVGVNKCKMCHNKTKSGAQYKVWSASPHAKAFEALKSEAAAKIVQERGIKTNAWETPECVKCHTTGFGQGGYEIKDETFWNPAPDDKDGKKAVKRMAGLQNVTCEACHGAGSGYKSMKTMKGLYSGTIEPASVGLTIPDEKTCVKCHNEESPSYKPFDYKTYVAKIAHNIPEDYGK